MATASPHHHNMGGNSNPYNHQQQHRGQPAHALVSPEPQKQSEAKHSGNASISTAATSSTVDNASSTDKNVRQLKQALEEANSRDATAKASLAKSDSVILELRSSIRTLKRQLEKLSMEKQQSLSKIQQMEEELVQLQQSAEYHMQQEHETHQKQLQQMQSQLVVSNRAAKESIVGELQVQLDRAHAQILTQDMVRRELEDTLEAEQYTWELRVQDQERTIHSIQQECSTLREDLEQCRAQWKEAEKGWTQEVSDLQKEIDSSVIHGSQTQESSNRSLPDWQSRMENLEKERDELQTCLDEAMQELEEIDKELQGNGSTLQPLKHLYQWVLERESDKETASRADMPDTADGLVQAIQTHIDTNLSSATSEIMAHPDSALKVAELEAQLSVYRGDLKAREESSAELRTSLKEAVALLKPLQDAVAKTEGEKQALQDQLDELLSERGDEVVYQQLQDRTNQVKELQAEVALLQSQLEDLQTEKKSSSSPPSSPERTNRTISQPANEEDHEKQSKAAKRDTERALQEMLRNAQGRFTVLHQENHDVAAENELLKEKLRETEAQLASTRETDEKEMEQRDVAAEMREAAIEELEVKCEKFSHELTRKELEVTKMRQELQRAKQAAPTLMEDFTKMKAELEVLREKADRLEDVEEELAVTQGDLEGMKEAEDVLTKSLKEALGLLRPLQGHLETAEREKHDLAKQLRVSQKELERLTGHSQSRSLGAQAQEDLELAVFELEEENNKLHSALEEVSQNRSMAEDENSKNQSKLKESLVEVTSRYEVTQSKLEGAVTENHALVDALKQKEHAESDLTQQINDLQERIRKSDQELENAKYIATSALMKVEEMTMANVEQMSMEREHPPLDVDAEIEKLNKSEQETPELQRLMDRVASLERELDSSRELNESLEMEIGERDRILQSIAAEGPPSPEMNGQSNYKEVMPVSAFKLEHPSRPPRQKGVSWGGR